MRPHTRLPASFLTPILAALAWAAAGSQLRADYYQSFIFTVEWLVDNSDVIAVLSDKDGAKDNAPTVVRTVKGDAGQLQFPLSRFERGGRDYWQPPSGGPVRLVFVRGKSELLQEVRLSRVMTNNTYPAVAEIVYGASEYGDLLLTETALFRAIEARLRDGPGHALPIHRSATWTERFGPAGAAVHAPSDFPLETSESTYVLIVPFTAGRRDHFARVLRTGNALERIQAVRELSRFDDEKALQAIRDATRIADATPAFGPHWGTEPTKPHTAKDVREAAEKALKSR